MHISCHGRGVKDVSMIQFIVLIPPLVETRGREEKRGRAGIPRHRRRLTGDFF